MSSQVEPDLWQLSTTLPLSQTDAIEEIFEGRFLTVSTSEAVPDGSLWRLEILFDGKPDRALLSHMPEGLEFDLAPLAGRDWVAESQSHLPPVDAGRFYIHGSHDTRHPTISRHDLTIDAGRAFGTGLHETTYGCLLALHDLRRQFNFKNALDLGCGAGVLALAIAKAWGRPVIASDIDLDAVIVTRENARKNRLSPQITAVHATGLNSRILTQAAPYDLIVANILAWPLVKLAPAVSGALAGNGRLVLSGLLSRQEVLVRNSYRLQGLHLERKYIIGEWAVLVLRRRA